MTARKGTWKGIAPEAGPPRVDSESPRSGIRLVTPQPRVPRPASRPPLQRPSQDVLAAAVAAGTEVANQNIAADDGPTIVDPLTDVMTDVPVHVPAPPPSRRAAVKPRQPRIPGTILPPAPPIPSLPPGNNTVIEIPAAKPSPIQVRSVVVTAQDWPLSPPQAPSTPRFGVKYRDSLHSLPAFLPPAALVADTRPPTVERVTENTIVRKWRASERRGRWFMMLAGFTLVVVVAMVVFAFAHL